MIAAVATVAGSHVVAVRLTAADATTTTVAEGATGTEAADASGEATVEVDGRTIKTDTPFPLAVEMKELIPTAASFLLLFGLMRFVLYPRVHGAMEARRAHVAANRSEADRLTSSAKAEVAEYESALAAVKAEAAATVDAARLKVEADRSAAVAEANGRIASKRSVAASEADAAKSAAAGAFADAAHDVVGAAAKMVLGRDVDATAVRAAVSSAMNVGAGR